MAIIKLTKGMVAVVDNVDLRLLSKHKWCFDGAYPCSRIDGIKKRMHSFLLEIPKGFVCDHKDGDKLNNSRSNLRVCTRAENNRNKRYYNGSGFKGVTKCPRTLKWLAQITIDYKHLNLGRFSSKEKAAKAYKKAAIELHKEFAQLC